MPAFASGKAANVEEFVPGQTGVMPRDVCVWLTSFMAPVHKAGDTRSGLRPISLILNAKSDQVEALCYMAPRIQDTVVGELFQNPLTFDSHDGLVADLVEQRLVASINEALGDSARVGQVILVSGIPGSATQSIPRLKGVEFAECPKK